MAHHAYRPKNFQYGHSYTASDGATHTRTRYTGKQAPSRVVSIPRKEIGLHSKFMKAGKHHNQTKTRPRNRRKDKKVILTARCLFTIGSKQYDKAVFVEMSPSYDTKETVEASLRSKIAYAYGHEGEITLFKAHVNAPLTEILVA